MEDIARYVVAGFGVGVLLMTAILWFFVFREFERDIDRREK